MVNITDPLKNLYINDGNIPNGMLFAITYKDGEVFQHFGQTKEFKVFDSETGGSEILSSGQYSHGSLATLLEENGIAVTEQDGTDGNRGCTSILAAIDGRYAGTVFVSDSIRPESRSAISSMNSDLPLPG